MAKSTGRRPAARVSNKEDILERPLPAIKGIQDHSSCRVVRSNQWHCFLQVVQRTRLRIRSMLS